MKVKSKWKGAILATLALVLALSLAVVGAGSKAEALDNQWTPDEGLINIGLPVGAGNLIDVAAVPGTETVFVLCDQGIGTGSVAVFRSDNAGLTWMIPTNLGPAVIGGIGALIGTPMAEVGVDIEVSPNYAQDGAVLILTNDEAVAGGYVYTSVDKGVTWNPPAPFVNTVITPAAPMTLAVSPTFNSRISGGTIIVGGGWGGGTCVWMETWQSSAQGWTGTWTAVPSTTGDANCLDVMYAPTSSLRLISVQTDGIDTYGVTGGLTAGFPALLADPLNLPAPGKSNGADRIHLGVATGAVVAIGSDYDPVSTATCPLCPMYMFVGTFGHANSSTFWFDPNLATFADLKAASTLPAAHMGTSGLLAQGTYTRASLLTGCAGIPITYKVDVRTMVWDIPSFIEGDGGPMGLVSGNVGVLLESGNPTYALTSGILGDLLPGDLTCLSTSPDYGDSWSDTCLTQEPFITQVVDMAWVDSGAGFGVGWVVCNDGAGNTSVFKSPAPTSWKRVDRWQGVQRITISSDYEMGTGLGAIMLLDTGTTGGKVLRSLDDGESFQVLPADPVAIVTIPMTCFAAGTADDIFIGDWNGHVYSTHDGGSTWADSGQIASSIKSIDVPKFYATVQHVIIGVDGLTTSYMAAMISKDDGATYGPTGNGLWGPGGTGLVGHIEAKFSPTYTGVVGADNFAYLGIFGTGGDGMHRVDLQAAPATQLIARMAVNAGAVTPIANFDIIHYPGINSDSGRDNIMYVAAAAAFPDGGQIYATYNPETTSVLTPMWRNDGLPGITVPAQQSTVPPAAGAFPTMWQAGVAPGAGNFAMRNVTPGGTFIPTPLSAMKAALSFPFEYEPGQFITITLNWATIRVRDAVATGAGAFPWDVVWSNNETGAFLTPIAMTEPANGALVPSNNISTGEPVELQWPAVDGAVSYDIIVCTEMGNMQSWVVNDGAIAATELSIFQGALADGATYYWRTRVASTWGAGGTGDHTGPWSAWQSFSVGFQGQESPASIELVSPGVGSTNEPLMPNFAWQPTTQTAADSVTGYVFMLATDASFSEETTLVDENVGMQQGYGMTEELEYETTYYWSVTASGQTGTSTWTLPHVQGIFTTAAEVIEPEPTPQQSPVIIQQTTPPDDATPAWVWVLIVIGAVLAVVVIVLIVRTRRPA